MSYQQLMVKEKDVLEQCALLQLEQCVISAMLDLVLIVLKHFIPNDFFLYFLNLLIYYNQCWE